jgi:hypothetical protein
VTAGAEPGACRSRAPDSRGFYADGAVLRALGDRSGRDWRFLAAGRAFGEAAAEARLVATEEVIVADELPPLRTESPATVLRRIGGDVKKELRSAGVGKRVLRAKMRGLVAGLRSAPPAGVDHDRAFVARMLGDAFEVAGREVVRAGGRAVCDVLPR